MGKGKSVIDKIIEALIMVIMAAMSVIVLWQVVTRFILGHPSVWTEEVAKYLMVWIGFLAGAMGLKYGTHLGLTLLMEHLRSPGGKLALQVLITLLCTTVGVLILVYGWQFMLAGARKLASAIPIPMSYVYSVVPLSGAMVILNCIESMVRSIREFQAGKGA